MTTPQLKLLRRAYLACRPLSELRELLELASLESTEVPREASIVEEVIRNPVSRKYPPCKSYRLGVIKLLISFLESNLELVDHLYEELASIVADSFQDDSSYMSYEIGDREFQCVTLRETRAFVTQGSTGFRSWPAAKILVEVLLNENLEKRRILELGAGTGLTGLVLLKKRPDLGSYTFTDCHPGVLETLRQNIELNLGSNDSKARVQLLDWRVGGSVDADLIVGSDIVFDRDIVPSLVETIVDAIRRNSCEAIISSVIRNEETYQIFSESVEKVLQCEKLTVSHFKYFERVSDKYEVIKLSRRKS